MDQNEKKNPMFDGIIKVLKKRTVFFFVRIQVLTEIFERSHKFRLLVLYDLQEVLAFVLETDPMSRPLPPPKAAKQLLNSLAINKVDEWVKSFGKAYPKLHHAYNFLR